jgi:GAF domain-containing protein
MLSAQDKHWQPVSANNHLSDQDRLILALEFNQVAPEDLENNLLFQEYLLINKDSSPDGVSQAISSVYEGLEDASFAIIPMRMDHQLASLIFIYSENHCALDENSLQYCVSLVDLASTSLQRLKSLEGMERQLNRLEVLESVSQAITFETDINNLYRVIHEQISRVMGDVNLIIATYEPETNLIEIPYAYEENQILSIPPFEMGDGLTSILIKSRKPLLLVEDTEKKAAELGAPLLLGGEPIGAIIVQDLENEHRFDDEDQKLLTTLSSQVAVTLRNARLLYDASTKAKFEQDAIEITNMLWSATDVESIMQTALEQLGKKLHASTGFIQLEISNSEQLNAPAEVLLP